MDRPDDFLKRKPILFHEVLQGFQATATFRDIQFHERGPGRMKIISTNGEDAGLIAGIVSEANKDVAELFKLNRENSPKHPSFCTDDWVLADLKRGEEYFLFAEDGIAKGCVAFEQADAGTAYLNRLSVLPCYRHNGIGASLVRHVLDYAKSKNIRTVSIGIIAEHEVLKNWYLKLGFIAGDTRKFDHLPFNVQYMRYES